MTTRKTPRNYTLETNLALEAAALSGGRPNFAYQRAQILRKHARRESLILKPVNAHRSAQRVQKRVWYEFSPEAEALLERSLKRSWPAIFDAMDAEYRTAKFKQEIGAWVEDVIADPEPDLYEAESHRRKYLRETSEERANERRVFWPDNETAESVERWAGCACGGTGYVLLRDADREDGTPGETRRALCETCVNRTRADRLDEELARHKEETLKWFVEFFARESGVEASELVRSRGELRGVLNVFFAAFLDSTGLPQVDGARALDWSESTASRVVKDVLKLWPDFGHTDSPALSSVGEQPGSAPESAGVASSTIPASLPRKVNDRAHDPQHLEGVKKIAHTPE